MATKVMRSVSFLLDGTDVLALEYLCALHGLKMSGALRYSLRRPVLGMGEHDDLCPLALSLSEQSRTRKKLADPKMVQARLRPRDLESAEKWAEEWRISTASAAVRFAIRAAAMMEGWRG